MIDGEQIGVGILTYNRPTLLEKLLSTLPLRSFDQLIIINDGDELPQEMFQLFSVFNYVKNQTNLGVGKSKNKAFEFLLEKNCDHIFLIEDDIFIKDPKVFEKYIETSKVTGIQHLNFSQHGMMNKSWPGGNPNPRVVIDYGSVKLPLYPHCVGAFSYYSKKCLETTGLIDERYYNACEHVDHTLEIIKKGMHPPFWYFADIENSWEYLGDEEWSLEKSTISSNSNHQQMMIDADEIFLEKHGHYPVKTPLVNMSEVGKKLKEIKKNYGRLNDSNM